MNLNIHTGKLKPWLRNRARNTPRFGTEVKSLLYTPCGYHLPELGATSKIPCFLRCSGWIGVDGNPKKREGRRLTQKAPVQEQHYSQLKVIGPHLHHEHWSDHHTCTTQRGAKCNLSILFCFSLNFQKLLLTVSHAVGWEEGSRHPHHGGGSSHLLGSPNLSLIWLMDCGFNPVFRDHIYTKKATPKQKQALINISSNKSPHILPTIIWHITAYRKVEAK